MFHCDESGLAVGRREAPVFIKPRSFCRFGFRIRPLHRSTAFEMRVTRAGDVAQSPFRERRELGKDFFRRLIHKVGAESQRVGEQGNNFR